MQIDNTKRLEALKHPGRPDAEGAEVSKEPKDKETAKRRSSGAHSTETWAAACPMVNQRIK